MAAESVCNSKAKAAYAAAAVHLGRAFLLADQPDPALDHLQAALDHALPGGLQPHRPLLIQEAERCVAHGDHREAIQRWQDIAALQADATPEVIYHQLSAAYADQVRRYRPIAEPPAEVLKRHGAIPSNHPLVVELLQLLRQARQQQWNSSELKAALAPLQERIAAAEAEYGDCARELSRKPCPLPDPPDPAAP